MGLGERVGSGWVEDAKEKIKETMLVISPLFHTGPISTHQNRYRYLCSRLIQYHSRPDEILWPTVNIPGKVWCRVREQPELAGQTSRLHEEGMAEAGLRWLDIFRHQRFGQDLGPCLRCSKKPSVWLAPGPAGGQVWGPPSPDAQWRQWPRDAIPGWSKPI